MQTESKRGEMREMLRNLPEHTKRKLITKKKSELRCWKMKREK